MSHSYDLIEACHKVYDNKFVAAYDGNLSARVSEDRILITPSSKCKGELKEEDLLLIDFQGNLIEGSGKVSTEAKIHLLAYNRREEIKAVVHCHPVHATALAAAGMDMTEPVFPEVILTIGSVPLCKYATPSTNELPESMEPYINFAWAMLFENHGAITFGKTIKEAYFRMEKLEHTAQTLIAAKSLGGAKALSVNNVEKLISIAESVYGIKLKLK